MKSLWFFTFFVIHTTCRECVACTFLPSITNGFWSWLPHFITQKSAGPLFFHGVWLIPMNLITAVCVSGEDRAGKGGPNSRKPTITYNPKFSSLEVVQWPWLQDDVHTPKFLSSINSKTFNETLWNMDSQIRILRLLHLRWSAASLDLRGC